MKINLKNFLYYLMLIALIFPRSFDILWPKLYTVINVLKVFSFCIIIFILIKKRIKISKFSKATIIFFLYLLIITMINERPVITYLKTYPFNLAILLLCEIFFNDIKKENHLRKIGKIFLLMLVCNLIGMGVCKYLYGTLYFENQFIYLLGQDNRFILYIIPPILCYNFLFYMQKEKKWKKLLFQTYLLSLFTLFVVWSVSAMLVLLVTFLVNLFLIYKKNLKFEANIKMIVTAIIALNVLIVFFRIQNIFEFFIVDILHKSLHLSYRTDIWDMAIEIFKNNPIKLVFGHGFYDVTNVFINTVIKPGGIKIILKPNHLHNIIMNSLYFYGIIGTILYSMIYVNIIKQISKLKKNSKLKATLILIFASISLLLIFDTFELYSLYYLILYFIYGMASDLYKQAEKKDFEIGYNSFKQKEIKDSVCIMMATYNGEKYLKEQLDSIINQTYKNWILYISDDHSTDSTLKILKQYCKKYKNKIVLVENTRKLSNARDNFNNVFIQTKDYDYYMFSDQDDVWDKNKISRLLYFIKLKEEKESKLPMLVYCDANIVDKNLNIINPSLIKETGKILPQNNLLNHILVQNYFPGCAVLFNNTLKKTIHDIYEKCEMHDWWLTLVAAYHGKIYFLEESLHHYRQHENNVIGAGKTNDIFKKYKERLQKLFKKNASFSNWKDYQNIVLKQAEELKRRDALKENKESEMILNKFIQTMQTSNKIKKAIMLFINHFTTAEIIRTFRLI